MGGGFDNAPMEIATHMDRRLMLCLMSTLLAACVHDEVSDGTQACESLANDTCVALNDIAYVEPDGPAEELMVDIWKTLLGLERVGARDSFFQLGGHSLMLTRLASRIRKTFQIEIPLQSLFLAPTIAEIASVIAIRKFAERAPDVSELVQDLEQLSSAKAAN